MKTEERQTSDTTTDPGFVWVYQYTSWDEASDSRKVSERFATIEVIRCGLGKFIPSSGKKIPVAKLIDGAFAE